MRRWANPPSATVLRRSEQKRHPRLVPRLMERSVGAALVARRKEQSSYRLCARILAGVAGVAGPPSAKAARGGMQPNRFTARPVAPTNARSLIAVHTIRMTAAGCTGVA